MEKKSFCASAPSWVSALLIGLGIFFLGVFIKAGFNSISNNARVVTVRGLSEREVEANKVTWPIVSKFVGNDLPTVYQNIETSNNAIVAFLKSNAIPFRYNVTSVIVVTSSKVKEVNKLIERQTELLKQGIAIVAGDYNYQTTYEYTDLNSIKPAMIADATKNARKAAIKFAEDSESNLGKIKTASQGQFSIENRDQYTPYIKRVRVVSTIQYYLKD